MHQTLDFLIRHGTWVLFTWVLAEQLGAPVPSVPILLASGALIGLKRESFPHAMFIVLAASALADSFWYTLGRHRGASVLRLLCRISLEPDSCVSSTRDWFRRLDAWALVIAKFVPGLGAIATPMAGLSRMSVYKFLAADCSGVLLWSGTYLGVGYLFREQLETVANRLLNVGTLLRSRRPRRCLVVSLEILEAPPFPPQSPHSPHRPRRGLRQPVQLRYPGSPLLH